MNRPIVQIRSRELKEILLELSFDERLLNFTHKYITSMEQIEEGVLYNIHDNDNLIFKEDGNFYTCNYVPKFQFFWNDKVNNKTEIQFVEMYHGLKDTMKLSEIIKAFFL